MKKRYKIILIVIAVLAIALFITHKILSWDEPPFDDSDLAIEWLDIPGDENALTYFNEAANLIIANKKEHDNFVEQLYDDKYNPELSTRFIERHSKAFEAFKRGLGCGKCQSPRINPLYPHLSSLQRWRALARALSVRSLHFVKLGKDEDALDAAVEIIQFGHMLENCRGSSITHSTAMAIKAIGLSRTRKVIVEAKLSPNKMRYYIEILEPFKSNEEALINTMKVQYEQERILTDQFAKVRSANPFANLRYRYGFKPNATKRLYAENTRFFIDKVSKPWPEIAHIEVSAIFDDRAMKRVANPVWPNEAGIILANSSRLLLKNKIKNSLREKISISATQLLIALKCYKIDNGDLPESLDELVPEYIDKIPIDDFDGKPLRYSKQKKIIYSVGPDMKDDGGPSAAELKKWDGPCGFLHNADDPAVKIDF